MRITLRCFAGAQHDKGSAVQHDDLTVILSEAKNPGSKRHNPLR